MKRSDENDAITVRKRSEEVLTSTMPAINAQSTTSVPPGLGGAKS